MSWLDKVTKELTITTGDGKQYTPHWLNARKTREFHITEFDFPNVEGTLVDRRKARGRKYDIDLYFQGEFHLDVSTAFDLSAADSRAWTLSHPYYGELIVQPLSLEIDNTVDNISKITVPVMETLSDILPKVTSSPADKIIADKVTTDEAINQAYVGSNPEPSTTDVTAMSANNTVLYNLGKDAAATTTDAENYFNAFNEANSAILSATSEPLAALRTAQAVINAPAQFTASVRDRLDVLQTQFLRLSESLTSIYDLAGKLLFENNAGTIIGSMAYAAATPQDGDYDRRTVIAGAIETILDNYNQYITDLDSLQSDNGGREDSFVPGFTGLFELSSLVNYTVSHLYELANGAQQERIIHTEEDSNIIILCHRFYGLDSEDVLLNKFIADNNIGLSEFVQVRKGRRIAYYV